MDEEDSLEDDHLRHVERCLRQMKASRYLFRDARYRKRKNLILMIVFWWKKEVKNSMTLNSFIASE
jgi:hypothetical protein